MLSLSSACGNSWHHKCKRKSLLVPQRMLMKWALKVWIAFLAWFCWWLFGRTSWNDIWFLEIVYLKSLVHSLSSMCCVGLIPALCRWSISYWYALIISPDVWFFMAATKIALLLISHSTMMYWLPLLIFFGIVLVDWWRWCWWPCPLHPISWWKCCGVSWWPGCVFRLCYALFWWCVQHSSVLTIIVYSWFLPMFIYHFFAF